MANRVATEETLTTCANLLGIIVKRDVTQYEDYKEISKIVRNGDAEKCFSIGDQIMLKWSPDGNTEYDMPMDVVHFGNVELEGGSIVPGMYLQSHWATPGVQFDGNEAFYIATEGLQAGTYNITMGNSCGTHVISGKTYQFTLANDVPVNGQLVFTQESSTIGALPDQPVSNWRVRSYESSSAINHIEMVTVSEGDSGTSLGTLSSSTKYGLTGVNNMQRASYGYNRWSQSAMRQYLNSSAAVGAWWIPQNPYDRAPDQLSSMRGFMAGLPENFVDIIKPVKVVTALNTVSDIDIGASETTYDKFFLASLEQEYIVPQAAGVEGEVWEYWENRLGVTSPQKYYNSASDTNALATHIRYAIENHSSVQHCRLRSALRGYAFSAWYVSSSGYVISSDATYAVRPAAACVIC